MPHRLVFFSCVVSIENQNVFSMEGGKERFLLRKLLFTCLCGVLLFLFDCSIHRYANQIQIPEYPKNMERQTLFLANTYSLRVYDQYTDGHTVQIFSTDTLNDYSSIDSMAGWSFLPQNFRFYWKVECIRSGLFWEIPSIGSEFGTPLMHFRLELYNKVEKTRHDLNKGANTFLNLLALGSIPEKKERELHLISWVTDENGEVVWRGETKKDIVTYTSVWPTIYFGRIFMNDGGYYKKEPANLIWSEVLSQYSLFVKRNQIGTGR